MDGRLQLGCDVFARGVDQADRTARVADVTDLFRACLVVLRTPDLAKAYTPGRPPLWRVADASEQITRLLSEGRAGGGGRLRCSCTRPGGRVERELRCRAALASTLVAGLELARNGAVQLSAGEEGHGMTLSAGDPAALGFLPTYSERA